MISLNCSVENCKSQTDLKLRDRTNTILCNRHYRQLLKGIPFGIYAYTHYQQIEILQEYAVIHTISGHKFLIDLDDVEFAKSMTWHVINDKRGHVYLKSTKCLFHRAIMNCPKNMLVDHIDCDTFNNRKYNLRITTRSGNNINRKNVIKAITPINGKFRVGMNFNGKMKYFGTYSDIEEAKAVVSRVYKDRLEESIKNDLIAKLDPNELP